MAFDAELYFKNCKHMLELNQEQVEEWDKLIEQEYNPRRKKDLKEEREGWVRWVKIWEDRLKDASLALKNKR